MPNEKADVIARVCHLLVEGNRAAAASTARAEYPFAPRVAASRVYSEFESMQIFLRDGFVDRYAGTRLVFPGTLRLLSQLLPEEFPAHPNWKLAESHFLFWELFPAVDHVVSVTRGGADEPANWVTTSMLKNSAKSSWTLEELGWALHPPGDSREWDGLTRWFLSFAEGHPEALSSPYVKRWHAAAVRALSGSR